MQLPLMMELRWFNYRIFGFFNSLIRNPQIKTNADLPKKSQ